MDMAPSPTILPLCGKGPCGGADYPLHPVMKGLKSSVWSQSTPTCCTCEACQVWEQVLKTEDTPAG